MMRKQLWCSAAVGFLAAALLAGCGQKTDAEVPSENKTEKTNPVSVTQVKEPEAVSAEDFESRSQVRENNPVSGEFVSAAQAFSYDSAARLLAEGTENRNYSPLSLYYALALAAQGAEGKPEEEMLAVLGMKDKAELAAQCGNLYRLLYTDHEYSRLKLANSLWTQQGVAFKDGFLKTAQDDFYASVFLVDFAGPEAGIAMGQWISQNTGGILSPQMETSPRDVLVIINTVYFNGQWINRFEESSNTEGSFTTAENEEVRCEYMHLKNASQTYYEGDGYSGTELWMKDNGSLMLILPDEGVEIGELIRQEGKLEEMFSRRDGQGGLMDLSLPKFRFGDSLELADMLRDMGVKEAFEEHADFSAMSDEPAFISRIKQETHIGVNEDGVEAAAYTEIAMAGAGLPEGRHVLDFNRPFLFGIISDQGIPLFLGVCNNPQ